MHYRRKYSDYLLLPALALIYWAILVLVTNKREIESDETDFDVYVYDEKYSILIEQAVAFQGLSHWEASKENLVQNLA